MINIDKLKSVKHLVTHANCPDGVASALIVKDAIPDVRVSFMAYGSKEHRELEPAPGTLFCDFTPYVGDTSKYPLNREDGSVLDCWVKAGAIVLDHHPTAQDIVEAFGENGVFGLNERNECGAWLAYEHVWKHFCVFLCELRDELVSEHYSAPMSVEVENFARLAAIRDTWKKDDPQWREACEQAALLLFWPFDDLDIRSDIFLGSDLGKVLVGKQLSAAQRSLDEAHYFQTTKGTRVCVFQGVSTTSDAAELFDNPGQVPGPDLVVGFHYKVDADKLQLQFSTRSHTGYDCASFAKAHGGGGHRAAAGFTVEVSPELSVNPYAMFRLLLEEFEG